MQMQRYVYSASDVNFVISIVCTQLEGDNTVAARCFTDEKETKETEQQ